MDYVNEYFQWLKDNTFVRHLEKGYTKIQLPFLNHNNDYTEIYIKELEEDRYLLTDDGQTISELSLLGLKLVGTRKVILQELLISFGVSIDNDRALSVIATSKELPLRKHMLIQCISKVSDMFLLKKDTVKSLFLEDVTGYLDANNVRYLQNASFLGRSNLHSQFDYSIPKSKESPQRFIKAMNVLSQSNSKLLMFSWEDTRISRDSDSKLYAFINDIDSEIDEAHLIGLSNYEIIPVKWSQRENYTKILAS